MTDQISIYAENKKGAMSDLTGLLRNADINLLSILTNDSGEFGTIRMLVNDTEKACQVLKEAGYQVHVEKVIGVYMEDRCGGLHDILQAVADSNINIHYIYISYDRSNASPIAIMKTSGYAEVEACLKGKGFQTLG